MTAHEMSREDRTTPGDRLSVVVVSHYNAWPTDQLVALLDGMAGVPAGAPFRVRIVVNRAVDRDLILPERHRLHPVSYRENTGYNIGAWDAGWRVEPTADRFLFLQEECRVLRPGWLRAFLDRLDDPGVGLLGECLAWGGLSWDRLAQYYSDMPAPEPVDGRLVPIPVAIQVGLRRLGIEPGHLGAHLQSLVWATRRDVLEAIDGFRIAASYFDATIAEVAASKQVEGLGLLACRVGPGTFRHVLHPQWARRRGMRRSILDRVEPLVPVGLAAGLHRLGRSQRFNRLKARLRGRGR